MTVIQTGDFYGLGEGLMFAREVPDQWWMHQSTAFGRDVLFFRIIQEAQA